MRTVDYKALCKKLFGTTDVKELERIAAKVNQRNPRNAGRKRFFNEADVREMEKLAAKGIPFDEIAAQYQTTRQTVNKYLNRKPDGYTMRIDYCNRAKICTVIDVDFHNERIRIQNRTEDILHRAFGANENPSWSDFELFLEDRCIPRSRGYLKETLNELQVAGYDPLQIAEAVNGRTAEDNMWMKFHYFREGDVGHAGN